MGTDFKLFTEGTISAESISLNLDIDDYFFIRGTQRRVIELMGDITDPLANVLIRSIIQINQEDEGIPVEERTPIKLLLSSDGGAVDAGFAMIDAIVCSKTPVYMINVGRQYSMAAIVGLAGHKRYAFKNSTFLIHDGSMTIRDSGNKVHDFIKFDLSLEKRMKEFVITRTNVSTKMYNSKARDEWYLFADEAKKLGFIDGIIGEDISLEEII